MLVVPNFNALVRNFSPYGPNSKTSPSRPCLETAPYKVLTRDISVSACLGGIQNDGSPLQINEKPFGKRVDLFDHRSFVCDKKLLRKPVGGLARNLDPRLVSPTVHI